MTLEDIKSKIPDYAKDLRLNLSAIEKSESLEPRLVFGVMLACAAATKNGALLCAVEASSRDRLDDATRRAAFTAAALMAMNNIYYRFLHLASNKAYAKMPAQLRMQAIGNPGIEKKDFELFCLAVSAINGCGMCIDSHEQMLSKAAVTPEAIQAAIRIASVIHAVGATLTTEDALATG